jgi:hypothetical protein
MKFAVSSRFQQRIAAAKLAVEAAAEKGMQTVIELAEEDAQALAGWNAAGPASGTYGDVQWEWEVTDTARRSISGYVVPRRRLNSISSKITYSTRTNVKTGYSRRLEHRHELDTGLAKPHSQVPGKVIGVLTMPVAYGPHLQKWERQGGGTPVTLAVFRANWAALYFRLIALELERACKRALSS